MLANVIEGKNNVTKRIQELIQMFEVKFNKGGDLIIIKWQFSKVEIPISDIIRVNYDNTYSGSSNKVMRIGYLYGTTDKILIHTLNKII